MEAFLALGETTIPAVIVDATNEERQLMSLVENIARRPPSTPTTSHRPSSGLNASSTGALVQRCEDLSNDRDHIEDLSRVRRTGGFKQLFVVSWFLSSYNFANIRQWS